MGSDYEQAGMPYDRPGVRVDRMIEGVRIIKALHGDGPVDFDGEHYTITGHDALPKPVQRPHPPIMIGAGGKRLLTFAAQEADIIGLNPRNLGNDAWEVTNVGDATDEATDRKVAWIRDAAGTALRRHRALDRRAVHHRDRRPRRHGRGDRVGLAAGRRRRGDSGRVLDSPYVLLGTLDEMAATIEARRERWGISYYVFNDDSIDVAGPLVERLTGK